jgi:hypothetical protein
MMHNMCQDVRRLTALIRQEMDNMQFCMHMLGTSRWCDLYLVLEYRPTPCSHYSKRPVNHRSFISSPVYLRGDHRMLHI